MRHVTGLCVGLLMVLGCEATPSPEGQAQARERPTAVKQSRHDSLMSEGDDFFHRGEYEKAADAFSRAASLLPESAVARLARGHALFALGRFEESARSLREGMQYEPQWAFYELDLRGFYGDDAEFERHVSKLEAKLAERAEPECLFELAYIRAFSGARESARDLFAEAVHLEPHDHDVLYFLGALSQLTGARASDTENPDALVAAGDAYLHQGQLAEGAAKFKQAIDLYPGHPIPRLAYGHTLLALGRHREAAETIIAGVLLQPGWGRADIDLHAFFPGSTKIAESLRSLEKTLEETEEAGRAETDLAFLLGYMYHFTGETERALEVFRRLERIAPYHRAGLYLRSTYE